MALTRYATSDSIRSMIKLLRKQKGGASLLVTVVLAVLLLGVVGGLTTLSVRELRQASNTEQSNRALTAAESYVQKLGNKISSSNFKFIDSCQTDDTLKQTENIEITCYSVSAGKGDYAEKELDRDRSMRLELTNLATPIASMSMEWSTVPATDFFSLTGWPASDGNGQTAAAIESTFVWWDGAPITPVNDANGDYGFKINKYLTKPGGTSGPIATECSSDPDTAYSDGYFCRTKTAQKISIKTVTNLDAVSNLVVKVTPRYNSSRVRLKFYDANGKQLEIPLPYAKIDVTARANNLYRRVIATKDLSPTSTFDFLDGNVLFSGKNICKSLQVNDQYKPVAGGDGKNDSSCESGS